MGAVVRRCVSLSVRRSVREGWWVQVTNYSVHDSSLLGREFCSLCCRGFGLVTAEVGWNIYSSYWLEESRCAVIVGWLI